MPYWSHSSASHIDKRSFLLNFVSKGGWFIRAFLELALGIHQQVFGDLEVTQDLQSGNGAPIRLVFRCVDHHEQIDVAVRSGLPPGVGTELRRCVPDRTRELGERKPCPPALTMPSDEV